MRRRPVMITQYFFPGRPTNFLYEGLGSTLA